MVYAGTPGYSDIWVNQPNLELIATGAPSYVIDTPTTCSFNYATTTPYHYLTNFTYTVTNGTCRITLSQPVSIRVKALPVPTSGSLGSQMKYPPAYNTVPGWVQHSDYFSPIYAAPTGGVLVPTGVCTLSPGDANQTVTLPATSPGVLNVAGATAGATPFSLNLTGCTRPGGTYNVNAYWSFTQGLAADQIANSASSGAASNVVLQILDGSNTPVSNGSYSSLGTVTSAGQNLNNTYSARYYATGAATAGAVQGVATFNLVYN